MFNSWWLAKWSKQQKSSEMQKRPPKSSKNEMLSFGLRSTSDDQPSDLSDKNWQKCEKSPLSHHKMKCSFLDYVQLLMIGWAIRAMKVEQNVTKGPLNHRTMKCSFLDYIQILLIGCAIQATKVNWNAEKGPLIIEKWNTHFYIMFNFWWSAKQSKWQKLIKMQKKVKCCFS